MRIRRYAQTFLPGDVSQTHKKEIEVSTKLQLFDKSWLPHNVPGFLPKIKEPVAKEFFKIQRMKYYKPEEEEEERKCGISTKLELYSYPWKVNKKLSSSDVRYAYFRLLVPRSLVHKFVLPFLSNNDIYQVESNDGFRVMVYDCDTNSMHLMVLKRWRSSHRYVFNDGWIQGFVRRRNLKEGDEIGFYWDAKYSRFCFSLLKRFDKITDIL